jgi:hypothetical protein
MEEPTMTHTNHLSRIHRAMATISGATLLGISALLGCATNLTADQSEDGAEMIDLLANEETVQRTLASHLDGEELVVMFDPAGPSEFGIDYSTLDGLGEDVSNLLAISGVEMSGDDLTDRMHESILALVQESWGDMGIEGTEDFDDNGLCGYEVQYDVAFDRLETVGLRVDEVRVDFDAAREAIAVDLMLTDLTLSTHVRGDVELVGGFLCPDFGDELDDGVLLTADFATLSFEVEFYTYQGSCDGACCDQELEAVFSLNSAYLSGVEADLPIVEMSFLYIDVDLDEHITAKEIEGRINAKVASALPMELASTPVVYGLAVATDVTFTDDDNDHLTFDWVVDLDEDGLLACDPSPTGIVDDDLDGVSDDTDNCPGLSNPSQDDTDGDGVGDECDNCETVPNPGQGDTELDGIGNECDPDDDNDGVDDPWDNCPIQENPKQEDADKDGIGDACEDNAIVDQDELIMLVDTRFQAIAHVFQDYGVSEGPWGSWSKISSYFDTEDFVAEVENPLVEIGSFDDEWTLGYIDAEDFLWENGVPKTVYCDDVSSMLSMDPRVDGELAAQFLGETLGM